ncbi:hypothetical protein PTTG_29579, partial [Puccinia triticina 1-1 BBBD Race 1]
ATSLACAFSRNQLSAHPLSWWLEVVQVLTPSLWLPNQFTFNRFIHHSPPFLTNPGAGFHPLVLNHFTWFIKMVPVPNNSASTARTAPPNGVDQPTNNRSRKKRKIELEYPSNPCYPIPTEELMQMIAVQLRKVAH